MHRIERFQATGIWRPKRLAVIAVPDVPSQGSLRYSEVDADSPAGLVASIFRSCGLGLFDPDPSGAGADVRRDTDASRGRGRVARADPRNGVGRCNG